MPKRSQAKECLMWKSVAAIVAVTWVAACDMRAVAKTETVTGQVVDLKCYARDKANVGRDHDQGRECAAACVKWEGDPVGLIATDGRVFQLAGGLVADNNAEVAPHLAHTVTITGEVSQKDETLMLTSNELKMATVQ
jgi:hypothetical protein